MSAVVLNADRWFQVTIHAHSPRDGNGAEYKEQKAKVEQQEWCMCPLVTDSIQSRNDRDRKHRRRNQKATEGVQQGSVGRLLVALDANAMSTGSVLLTRSAEEVEHTDHQQHPHKRQPREHASRNTELQLSKSHTRE